MVMYLIRFSLFTLFIFLSIKGYTNGIVKDYHEGAAQFIENNGQWDSNIKFKLPLTVGDIFFEDNLITFSLYDPKGMETLHELSHQGKKQISKAPLLRCHAYQMMFLNSNLDVEHKGFNQYEYYTNYFIGDNSSKWASNVMSYGGIQYLDIYQGVDVKVYGYKGSLKYDLMVAPYADVSQIQIEYLGIDELYLKDGNLHVVNSVNPVTESKPVAYQVIDGRKVDVPCAYELEGTKVTFSFPAGYDNSNELVIDPELIFSTYSGSTADNWGYTATYDEGGYLYSAGVAFGVGYPLTVGAFQTGFAGGPGTAVDIALSKYTPDGSNLVYSTYLGGNNAEIPLSLVVNANDELYIYGATGSSNFPHGTNAYDGSFNGGNSTTVTNIIQFTNGSDIFVSKFSAAGDALIGSTYIGGGDNDGLNLANMLHYNYGDHARGEVFVDDVGNCFVASSTFSSDFPTSNGTYDSTYSAGQEGCVFKLNADLSFLEWSTFLGGSGEDASYSIKLDNSGNVYVSGGTTSSDIIQGSGGINPNFLGDVDGYLFKLANDGTSVLASTYIGTSEYDQAFFVELDDEDDVYIFGQTLGSYPIQPSGIYNNASGKQFIHKLNDDLSVTLLSTVFGSGSAGVNISPTALLVDVCGRIYAAGWGGSTNTSFNPSTGTTTGMPVTTDAYRPNTDGSDFYFIVLERDADSLLYATFFGGTGTAEHCDGGTSRFDKSGIIYQAVCAGCGGNSLFPTTPGVWSNSNNSNNCNLGSIKFQIQLVGVDVEVLVDGDSYTACFPYEASLNAHSENAHSWFWDFGDGTTSTEENPSHLFDSAGVFEVTVIGYDSLTCDGVYFNDTSTALFTIIQNELLSDAGEDKTICLGDSVTIGSDSTIGTIYFWTPLEGLSSDSTLMPLVSPETTTTYYLIASDTVCEANADSVTITVITDIPEAQFEHEYIVNCEGVNLVLTNKSTNSTEYYWDFGDGITSHEDEPIYFYDDNTGLNITLVAIGTDGCVDTLNIDETNLLLIDSSNVRIPNAFSPNGDGQNDYFIAKLTPELENCVEVVVFNRWGRKVFESGSTGIVWDGKLNDKSEVEEGVYYYIVKIKNEEFAGFVELFR